MDGGVPRGKIGHKGGDHVVHDGHQHVTQQGNNVAEGLEGM